MSIKEQIVGFRKSVQPATLVAVSKTKPIEDLMQAYEVGQRHFGENKIQEMTQKWEQMPKDIQWHMIGNIQRNKVKYMAPFVHLIHGVDSLKLLKEINKQALKNNRVIDCLLQIKIAQEDTKAGLTVDQATELLESNDYKELNNVKLIGLMGMASFTKDTEQIKREFMLLKNTYDIFSKQHKDWTTLSMGMTGDHKIAIQCGSTMVRIGSAIFGSRNYA